MKNVKMMLLSLALFAVVGGALAFKAKFQQQFCTGVAIGGDNRTVACPNRVQQSTFGIEGQAAFVATTTYDNNQCKTTNLKCTTTSTVLTTDTP